MLGNEQIKQNKERFISLLRESGREGIEKLIEKLEHSDFFIAPASTQYHNSFEGGLCAHSLNVYDNLTKLNEIKGLGFHKDSMIVVALLHDLSKMNFYKKEFKNVKDESGNWIQVPFYKMKEAKERFIYAGHGTNSEFMVRTFIQLTTAESVAIINHMGGRDLVGGTVSDAYTPEIFNRYPLALYLHMADMIATFSDERVTD